MPSLPRRALAALAFALPFLACAELPPGPADAERADLGARIDSLARRGAVTLVRIQNDTEFPGRRHFRYDQRVDDVRVFGAQLVQQVDAEGRTLSVFGRIDEGLAADVVPALSADQAARSAETAFPRGAVPVGKPELVLLPRDGDTALTWMLWVRFDHHLDRVFVDARTGALVWRYADLRTEAAVGLGTGVWGDRKKVSTDSGADGFRANDRLRPPALTTYDLRFGRAAASQTFAEGSLDPSLVARSANNNWVDGAVVDAHVYAGWTYDYYYQRHGRRGIDGQNLPVRSVTHFHPRSAGFANAFWDPALNAMFYGDGDVEFGPFSGALDVVVHEMTHGVTQYTWDGIYVDESGALNEAFSDIMATGAEFFHEPEGRARLHADYFLGEDLTFRFDPPRMAVRSMEDPSRFCSEKLGVCDADHYSQIYRGRLDNGGVHHNSAIANQAFYLFVEGGTNRTSGFRVEGLGPDRRGDAERIFYRGFTAYLTPSATFVDARAATLRAARDLYGETEAAQVAAAWTAVGVE
jgi:Zn-dependent metalloprotease